MDGTEDFEAGVGGVVLCKSTVVDGAEEATVELSPSAKRDVDGLGNNAVVGASSRFKVFEVISAEELNEVEGITIGVDVFVSVGVEAIEEVLRNRRNFSCLFIYELEPQVIYS